MKTLDEVITALEGSARSGIKDDAIAYLKAYKDDREDLTALRAFWAEQQENDPLTWDELKTMEGKPVWVEHPETQIGRWIVIAKITGRNEDLACMNATDAWGSYWKKYQGLEWQAYRKERQ